MRSLKITTSLAVLAVGAALSAVPAWAQQGTQNPVGRPLNDGGFTVQNDGGQPVSTARNERNTTSPSVNEQEGATPQAPQYSLGRPLNDGGFAMQQTQSGEPPLHAQRSGSAENNVARRGNDVYGFNEQRPIYNSASDWSSGWNSPRSGMMDQGAAASCQARFRSFDPATGTYLGFDGRRHTCG